MKRSFILLTVTAFLLAACATTAASTQGTISALDGGKLTLATADAKTATINVNRGTEVWWASGLEAQRASLSAGQRVKVWSDSNNNATKIVIEP